MFSLAGFPQVFETKRAQLVPPEEVGPPPHLPSSPDQLSDLPGFGQTLQGPGLQELREVHLHRSGHGD